MISKSSAFVVTLFLSCFRTCASKALQMKIVCLLRRRGKARNCSYTWNPTGEKHSTISILVDQTRIQPTRQRRKIFFFSKLIFQCYLILSFVPYRFGTKLPPGTPFIVYCMGCRIVTALGGFCCYTTILSIASQEFPSDYGFVVVSATEGH